MRLRLDALIASPMASDPKARKLSIGFPSGSLTASRGLLEALFGENLVNNEQYGESTVSVKGHSRTRVIGGATTSVAATTYTRKKYPTGQNGGAAGGEPIQFFVGGDWWTVRLSGSHQDLNSWLQTSPGASTSAVIWRSEKGTSYGPFASGPLLN